MYVKSVAYVPGVPVLPDWMEEKCETRTDVLSESWKKLRREALLFLTHNSRLSGQSYVPPDSGDQEWHHHFPFPGKGRYRAQQHCSEKSGKSYVQYHFPVRHTENQDVPELCCIWRDYFQENDSCVECFGLAVILRRDGQDNFFHKPDRLQNCPKVIMVDSHGKANGSMSRKFTLIIIYQNCFHRHNIIFQEL